MDVKYSFVTRWQLNASLQEVWDAIYNSLEWPQWWKGAVSVIEIEKNDENGINGIRNYTWRSALPYKLNFNMRLIENKPLESLKGVAFGELQGDGEWLFTQRGSLVCVQYNWNVITTRQG